MKSHGPIQFWWPASPSKRRSECIRVDSFRWRNCIFLFQEGSYLAQTLMPREPPNRGSNRGLYWIVSNPAENEGPRRRRDDFPRSDCAPAAVRVLLGKALTA